MSEPLFRSQKLSNKTIVGIAIGFGVFAFIGSSAAGEPLLTVILLTFGAMLAVTGVIALGLWTNSVDGIAELSREGDVLTGVTEGVFRPGEAFTIALSDIEGWSVEETRRGKANRRVITVRMHLPGRTLRFEETSAAFIDLEALRKIAPEAVQIIDDIYNARSPLERMFDRFQGQSS
jgi:hypothetical protein